MNTIAMNFTTRKASPVALFNALRMFAIFSFYWTLRLAGLDAGAALSIAMRGMLRMALQRAIEEPTPDRVLERLRLEIYAMAGFVPDEGETLVGQWLFNNVTTDRGTDLQLGLFTNVAPDETITEAAITEPSGTGYARKTLTDGSWTNSPSDTWTYAQQTFTGGVGGWTGSVQGYFVNTTGTTARIAVIEVDSNGPYTIAENDTYDIDLSNTVA